MPQFDIIIDDGPHSLESQIFFLENYLDKVKPNGLLIIEDIQNISDTKILYEKTPSNFQSNISIIDLRASKNRYDDILFVIKK